MTATIPRSDAVRAAMTGTMGPGTGRAKRRWSTRPRYQLSPGGSFLVPATVLDVDLASGA